MPRARNIKPGFFMNEDLAECDLPARLLFIGLWCLADREGRLEDRPKRIGAFVFPYEDYDVDALLNQLHEHGFILRYEVDGGKYIQIINFKKHQNPHPKEAASVIPAPQELRDDAKTINDNDTANHCESCAEHSQTVESNGNSTASREKVLPSNGNSGTSRADILIPDILIPDILIPEPPLPQSGASTGMSVREPPRPEQTEKKPKKQPLTGIQLERFNRFWYEYPKKKAKIEAMKAWARLKPDEELFDAIMLGLRRARASWEWKKEGGRFIPYPATFLNQGRWEDEYVPAEQKPSRRDLQSMSVEEYIEAVSGEPPPVDGKMLDEIWGDKNAI
jgi:hypothetical protein